MSFGIILTIADKTIIINACDTPIPTVVTRIHLTNSIISFGNVACGIALVGMSIWAVAETIVGSVSANIDDAVRMNFFDIFIH
ncbi:hypothetical protein HPK02_05490 [Anoxybacillus flavithermus]|uniref:hypothetical protein n=1 Tax=Anoxybacillus flavithermus TaxID=33934 RepID=UPI00186751DE|nr:hypothetical protein [Anoxybacillus flavithermus]MBE2918356.1 hypothetical protein [Anoxybacillus flavithermus]